MLRRKREGEVSMLTVDITLPDFEEIRKLVREGREKGFLTFDEIVSGLGDVDLTKDQFDDFTTYLAEHGVDLLEGEQHKTAPFQEPAPAEDKGPQLDLSVEPS